MQMTLKETRETLGIAYLGVGTYRWPEEPVEVGWGLIQLDGLE